MKKNIINLAIVSCFTFTAMSAFADSDRSQSNRSTSDRSMSVNSDSNYDGSDRNRSSSSSRSNRSQQHDTGSDRNKRSNKSGVETSGDYGTTMSDRSRQSNNSESDDNDSFTSKGSAKQKNYYETYEYGRRTDTRDSVDSAKDAQAPAGKVLNRDRLNIECNTTEGEDSAGTKGRGCQPTGS